MLELLLAAGLALGVLVWALARYNVLARLRNRLDNAAAQIDVHLRRRHDLVAEVLHEHPSPELSARLHAARQAAGSSPPDRAATEAALAEAMATSGLFREHSPRLRAIETQIDHAAAHHNETVRRYDHRRGPGPAALVARLLGAGPRQPFADPRGRPVATEPTEPTDSTDSTEPTDPIDQERSHG